MVHGHFDKPFHTVPLEFRCDGMTFDIRSRNNLRESCVTQILGEPHAAEFNGAVGIDQVKRKRTDVSDGSGFVFELAKMVFFVGKRFLKGKGRGLFRQFGAGSAQETDSVVADGQFDARFLLE